MYIPFKKVQGKGTPRCIPQSHYVSPNHSSRNMSVNQAHLAVFIRSVFENRSTYTYTQLERNSDDFPSFDPLEIGGFRRSRCRGNQCRHRIQLF